MPAQASKALCSLLFCPERKQYLLKTPGPESDEALPLKRAKDTQTVSLLLSLFPSGERNFTVSVPVPPLTIPSPPVVFLQSYVPTADSLQDLEVIALKRSSGLQPHTHQPRQQSPQKSTELTDPPCQCQFPALGVPQLCQQTDPRN